MGCGVVLVTVDSEARAIALAKALIGDRLGACVNLFPVQSIYSWQGELHHDVEWQLVIKTDLTHYPVLEAKIRSLHPYELPEIIALPINQGSAPYLNWVTGQVSPIETDQPS